MRCLGCDKVLKWTSHRRSESWNRWQICPSCLDDLVPELYPKSIKARLKVYGN